MAKIPEEIVDKVAELSIKQVIEDATEITFSSRGFARSPFRVGDSEDTSFSISEPKNVFTDWKLRAQGYSGSPIKFFQLYFHLSFAEAVLELAGRYGIMSEEELAKYTRKKIERVQTEVRVAPKAILAERATPEKIDMVYRKILELSPLSSSDKQILLDRGFTEKEISDAKFFTLPTRAISKKLESVGITDLSGIPGFYKYSPTDQHFTFNATQGIGIPVCNVDGLIVGLQKRNRSKSPTSGQSRYGWVSSSMADGVADREGKVFGYSGVGPGCPIDYKKKGQRLCITEGIFKSIAILREDDWDFSVASVQGVGNWRGIDPILMRHSEVVIAFDSDLVNNDQVMNQVALLSDYVYGVTGNKAKVMYWKKMYGKGIDDVLFAGNKDKVTIVGYDEWAEIYKTAKSTELSEGVTFEEAFNRFF